jgi:hypothetical protein
MAVFEHKSFDIRFEISEQLTFSQLEAYEQAVARILQEHKDKNGIVTDMVLARSAMAAAYDAKILEDVDGLPERKKDLLEMPAQKIWWAASEISSFMIKIKEIPPN